MKNATIFPAEFSLSASSSMQAAAIMKHNNSGYCRTSADNSTNTGSRPTRMKPIQPTAGPRSRVSQRKEYPAEDRARDHRRQAKEQLRRSQLSPNVQEQNQQRRMSQRKTRLVGLRQRGFVRRQKVHGLVEVEKCPGGFPEAKKKGQQQHQAREAIFPCRTFSHGQRS